jgi:hypothetical protein
MMAIHMAKQPESMKTSLASAWPTGHASAGPNSPTSPCAGAAITPTSQANATAVPSCGSAQRLRQPRDSAISHLPCASHDDYAKSAALPTG